jgi:hypothetical protein
MQVLNPKAIQEYTSVLDYEARILVRSMYFETSMGTMPIDPACLVGRFTLKYGPTFTSVSMVVGV